MDNSVDLHYRLLERLESLARRILEGKLSSVQDMWLFEIDLLKFQLEQQRAMNAEQNRRAEVNTFLGDVCRAKEAGWEVQRQQYQDELEQNESRVNMYRHAYNVARQLGDTIAWIFLDRLLITSRSRDSSMPSSHSVPEGHGLQGMLAIAELLCAAGAGIPILHDITNCLRIGDITFYTPNHEPITIEAKTRLKGYQGDRMNLEVKIHIVNTPNEDAKWSAIIDRIPQVIAVPQDITDEEHHIQQQPQAIEERLERQLKRMAKVTALQAAQDGKPIQLGEREVAILQHLTTKQNMHHFDILQQLTREAKSQGFTYRTVDDAFVYTAIYKDTPLWLLESEQLIPGEKIEDYQHTLISIAFPEADKNYLAMSDVFNNPPFIQPFFLYPLPADIIIDIMWKRLQVVVGVNLGKLVAVLQSIGLDVSLPKNQQEFDEFFLPVSTEILLPNGEKVYGKFTGLQLYGLQITHEFLSLQGFVGLINAMTETTVGEIKKEERYSKIFPPESK
jgi:hypothetical protein